MRREINILKCYKNEIMIIGYMTKTDYYEIMIIGYMTKTDYYLIKTIYKSQT